MSKQVPKGWLHKRHAQRSPARIQRAAISDPAAIFAFDLLWLNGADFRPRPLLERKAALHRTLPANRRVRYARHINDDSSALWEMAVRLELEGIVAKDARLDLSRRPLDALAEDQDADRR